MNSYQQILGRIGGFWIDAVTGVIHHKTQYFSLVVFHEYFTGGVSKVRIF